MLCRSGICSIEMTYSKNYINKEGQHPEPGLAMDGDVVVFSKEELLGDKWFFCNNDEEIVDRAKKQTYSLRFFHNCIAIID